MGAAGLLLQPMLIEGHLEERRIEAVCDGSKLAFSSSMQHGKVEEAKAGSNVGSRQRLATGRLGTASYLF